MMSLLTHDESESFIFRIFGGIYQRVQLYQAFSAYPYKTDDILNTHLMSMHQNVLNVF